MKESKIPKFRRCVLQNFPFIEEDFDALTDYELLCKVVEYLNKVIDSQNDVVAKTDELIESFAQLKAYVDNYFDNLDVQEEINNKLEEMAEGGELAGIIAQFLEIAPVFGYGTIAEMAASDNLSNGCIARVLGNTSASAGDGAFYSIRTRIETDEPDGINVVAIGDNLIGERIIDEQNIKLQSLPVNDETDVMMFAFFDGSDNNKINFFTSEDAGHLKKIGETANLTGRDPSLLYKNGKFYLATTGYSTDYDFTVRISEDLNTWTEYHVDLGLYDANYPYRWAPEWFEDDNGKIYVVLSVQYAATQGWGDFKPYIAECTDLETLTFGEPQLMTLNGSTTNSHIDGSIVKYNNVYRLFIKSEDQSESNIEQYTSSDLINWTRLNVDPFRFGRSVEGVTTFKYGDQYYIMADPYKNRPIGKAYQVITKTNDFVNYANYIDMEYPEISLSHGGCCVIKKKLLNKLLTDGNITLIDKDYNLNLNNSIKDFHVVASQLTNNDQNSGERIGRYLHLFDVSATGSWRTNYVEFKISTTTSMDLIASYSLAIRVDNANVASIKLQETFCGMRGADVPASAAGKLFAVKDSTIPTLVHVYLDVQEAVPANNTPINLDILNSQLWLSNIIKYTDDFTDTIDTTSGLVATANGSYCSRNITLNNAQKTKARIVFAAYNGAVKIEGNTNATDDAHRLDGRIEIKLYDGSMNYINLNDNLNAAGKAITFTKEAFSNNEYTVLIENIPTASCMEISIPNSEKSYIKSVSYPD